MKWELLVEPVTGPDKQLAAAVLTLLWPSMACSSRSFICCGVAGTVVIACSLRSGEMEGGILQNDRRVTVLSHRQTREHIGPPNSILCVACRTRLISHGAGNTCSLTRFLLRRSSNYQLLALSTASCCMLGKHGCVITSVRNQGNVPLLA